MSFPRYEKYKESGVQWLGEVPSHWEVVPLKALASCNDEVLSESTVGEMEIQYVEISGVDANQGIIEVTVVSFAEAPSRARRCVKDGDVLVSTVRTYLRAITPVKMPPENMIASTGFAVIRPRSVHSEFLGYLCGSEFVVGEIISRSVGVSYPAINSGDLMRVRVALPNCTTEQSAIAAFLDRATVKIDALVAEHEKLIALMKEKRQAVISHAVTKGLDPSAPMKDSGIEWLGKVPAHWEIKCLKYAATGVEGIQMGPFGGMLLDLESEDTGYRVYGQQNTISGDFNLGNRWVTEERYYDLIKYELRTGDIVLTRKGSLGHARLIRDDISPGIIDSDTIRIRVDSTQINQNLLTLLFHEAQYVEGQIDATKRGAILSGINTETVANLMIVLPPRSEQDVLLGHLRQILSRIDSLITEAHRAIALLKEHRTALISAAVTGKIDLRGRGAL